MKKKPLTEEEKKLCAYLIDWSENISKSEIDATMEWMLDHGMLNKKGIRFAWCFWQEYIHEKGVDEDAKN